MVIVAMSCKKSFNIERKMLGVYKAMGFSSIRLRLQFVARYALVFLVGPYLASKRIKDVDVNVLVIE